MMIASGDTHPGPRAPPEQETLRYSVARWGNFDTEAADHARMRHCYTSLRPQAHAHAATSRGSTHYRTARSARRTRPPADLHAALALPLPILVICELLGVPYGDRDQFHQWTEDVANVHDPGLSEHGLTELYRYGMTLVEHKRVNPADDIISRLCATDGVTDDEVASMSMAMCPPGTRPQLSRSAYKR